MSFSEQNIETAYKEATRFVALISALIRSAERYGKGVSMVRRASQDLSDALVELRRKPGDEEWKRENDDRYQAFHEKKSV